MMMSEVTRVTKVTKVARATKVMSQTLRDKEHLLFLSMLKKRDQEDNQ